MCLLTGNVTYTERPQQALNPYQYTSKSDFIFGTRQVQLCLKVHLNSVLAAM
jgi:hypothetical protein